ncbi:DNA repair protein RecN [Desulfosediminicola sp.]|uniref:DNA repair protein RecN n=1 Tax=Desulfosediminicola sp. TaxID=2886825 RepID=UPI003AF22FF6
MLCELRVQNLALISSLELNFEEHDGGGLVVMTGETGAGKSIMLRAIHLLTGGRASADWIRNGSGSCVIEALFEVNPRHRDLLSRLDESGFGEDTTVVIKRVINQSGRSKLYVNGSLATVKLVSAITADMLSVASQHDHQKLMQTANHLDFLDTYGELIEDRQGLAKVYDQWQTRLAELVALHQQEQDKEQRRDFLKFQLEEIEQAAVVPGEDEELSAEKKRLKSANELIKISKESHYLFSNEILDSMSKLRRNLEQLVALDPQAEKMAEEIGGLTFQAEDYATELRHYRDGLESNPIRLEQVSERLDILHGLKRKYGTTLEEVIEYGEKAQHELSRIENMDREIAELEAQVQKLEKRATKLAADLSKRRRKVAAAMEKAMGVELSSLAFNQSGFEVRWQGHEQTSDNLRAVGWDKIEFFFSANPGEPARQLVKVASGGELSRLMLAVKCLLAKKDMVDTVIFDEVDAGIGGEAAEAVARKIKQLSSHHQVFCITHLPQIAARGDLHFQVSKEVEEGRTQSSVIQLPHDHRVKELARMLAGDSATEQTQAWAREMLEREQEVQQ